MKNIPPDELFTAIFVLRKTGEQAYYGFSFPGLMNKEEETAAEKMEIYLINRKFAIKMDSNHSLQLTDEGRYLLRIEDIAEYEKYIWWGRNWKWILGVITALGVIIDIAMRLCQ